MMKTRLWGIGIILIGCATAIGCVTYGYQPIPNRPIVTETAPTPGGSDQPFYDDLAPYGRWVYASGPGWAWSPYGVQADWHPYLLGHWVFTDYGWTWASDEQWGWAVYHYGRWHQDPQYGWVWVPGTEWGPAWVAWHEGGGYVGWAPLPWQVRVQAGVGLDWAGINVSLEPSSWCFVNARNLVDPGVRNYIMPPARNVTLIQATQNITNYTYINNRVVNQGVRVESIGRAVGHTIPHYRVAESETSEANRGGKVRGQDFVVFRPDPRRGRSSQGRIDPPGHDQKERPHDFRPAPPQPEPAPTGAQPAPPPQASTPPEPPPAARGQETENRAHQSHESRGRRFFDALTKPQPPRHSPQGTAPAPPAPPTQSPSAPTQPSNAPTQSSSAPAQPSNAPTQPSNAPAHPSAATPQPSTTTPPSRPEPARGQSAKPDGKGRKNAPPRGAKPKPDAPKPDGSDSEKSKGQGASSDH